MTTTMITPTLSALDSAGHEPVLGLITALILLTLLVVRDIAAATPDERRFRWNAALDIALVPLGMTFLAIAGVRVIDVLN